MPADRHERADKGVSIEDRNVRGGLNGTFAPVDHVHAATEIVVSTWESGDLEITRPRRDEVLGQLRYRRHLLAADSA